VNSDWLADRACDLLVEADLAEVRDRPFLRSRYLAASLAAGQAAHDHPRAVAEVQLTANLGREGIHEQVADERVEHRVAVVRAAEMLVAIVDLHVAGSDRDVLHHVVQDRVVDRRVVDLQVAVLDPRLLVVAGR
jgi:hypothetical protein